MNPLISKQQIFDIVLTHVRDVLPDLQHRGLCRNDSLKDLGANSLDRADIVLGVMESLSLRIPRVELFGPRNLGELVDLIHERLQQS